jgi:Helix-turn-helix domain
MLNRTFGCVRVVWNTILAARCAGVPFEELTSKA